MEPGADQRFGPLTLTSPRCLSRRDLKNPFSKGHRSPAIDRRSDRRPPGKRHLLVGERNLTKNLRQRVRNKSVNGDHGPAILSHVKISGCSGSYWARLAPPAAQRVTPVG